jgi:hypothetical protein
MSTPDALGYGDKLLLNENNKSLFHCACSTCPNPYRPSDKVKWDKAYGWVACTEIDKPYTWHCTSTSRHGKCLVLNDFYKVPTRNLDTHNKGFYALAVLIHCGYSETWRGSAACLTLPPAIWPQFIALFAKGEKGLLYIADYLHKTVTEITMPPMEVKP